MFCIHVKKIHENKTCRISSTNDDFMMFYLGFFSLIFTLMAWCRAVFCYILFVKKHISLKYDCGMIHILTNKYPISLQKSTRLWSGLPGRPKGYM